MRDKFLVGRTKDGNFAFIEPEITNRNGQPEFTLSAFEVSPVKVDGFGDDFYLNYLKEEYIPCFDEAELFRMCENYDCKPSELAVCLYDEMGADFEAYFDCSLYPETIQTAKHEYMFESSACGQHDVRGSIASYFMDEEVFNAFMNWWDNLHLEFITEDKKVEIERTMNSLMNEDAEKSWISKKLEEEEDDEEDNI